MANYIEQELFEWSSFNTAMGRVLQNWRKKKGFSLYEVAKFEDNEHPRTELFKKIEDGRGSMGSLLKYFDFIRCKDRQFLDVVLTKWCQELGFEL